VDFWLEKQAVRLAAVVYLNKAMVSYTIANGPGWNALVRNLALLSLLSVTGVRVGELTLNLGYQSQRDYLTYSLLWKDIDFLDEVDVVDGYGGVAIRAVIRIRNGKGKKNDPASDDLLQIFSLKPEWYLVDPIALLMSYGDGCYHLMLSEDEWGIVEIVCSILWPKRCAVQPL